MAQRPTAGSTAKAGERVDLGVAHPGATVPNLFKMTLDGARGSLEKQGLRLGAVDWQGRTPMSTGWIVRQAVKPGVLLPMGGDVGVTMETPRATILPARVPLKFKVSTNAEAQAVAQKVCTEACDGVGGKWNGQFQVKGDLYCDCLR